ncbi:hypothetical protein ACFQ6U_13565 [Streptomyces sp. NPDC056465]|uniref:hypothetical protein n=1 Tax=unclassified Streptomyces TaxID=2593676 RepID=UPI0035D7FA91
MNSASDTLDQELASGISDRAFRLYCAAVLRSRSEWTSISVLAAQCGLRPYQARQPVAELHAAGLLEKRCKYSTKQGGGREKSTLFRLRDDTPSEASA